jgi:endonuclease/exonuclease/phosphatase family metal-dependent hydrolase
MSLPPKEQGAIRVASYNIRKCLGTDMRRRPGRTLDVINRLDADVIALQEADRRLSPRPAALPRRLIEDGSDFRVADLDGGDSLGWHGNALLVRRGILAKDLRGLDLPGLEPRGAILARITAGPIRFALAATHLGLTRFHRQDQLRALRAALDDLAQPSLIAGDFNEWSETEGLRPLAGAFRVTAPGRSFHASLPMANLDRLAYTTALDLRAAGVDDTRLARRASDHLPVWADFTPAGSWLSAAG